MLTIQNQFPDHGGNTCTIRSHHKADDDDDKPIKGSLSRKACSKFTNKSFRIFHMFDHHNDHCLNRSIPYFILSWYTF